MKGLKPDIKAAVHISKPCGLAEVMEMAQLVEYEKKVERTNRGQFPTSYCPKVLGSESKSQSRPARKELTKEQPNSLLPGGVFKCLTVTEI